MHQEQENWRKYILNSDYRNFLKQYKTKPCQIYDQHLQNNCFYYHSYYQQSSQEPSHGYLSNSSQPRFRTSDRRKNPYSKMNQIIYTTEMCQYQNGDCDNEKCNFCHNYWQFYYHPYTFKTLFCENPYDCQFFFCSKLHYSDYKLNHKNNLTVFSFSEFFRFNLTTFKTIACKKTQKHDKSACLFYHNPKDCRRGNFKDYGHIQCKKALQGLCQDVNCPFSHNKIQQLYHPSRYKSKFCENHYLSRKTAHNPDDQKSFKSLCPFGQFCSFAHDESQLSVQLIDKIPRTLQFHLYVYKTVWCPITTEHNRSQCVYAHNIQDYRRNPKQYYYEPEECPEWKKNETIKGLEDAGCPKGMICQLCHGWKQKQYHPVIFSKSKSAEQKSNQIQESYTSSDGNKQKTDSSQAKQCINEVIETKLTSNKKGKNKLIDIIQQKLKETQPYYKPGTPFFKYTKSAMKPKSKSQIGSSLPNEDSEKFSQTVEKGSFQTTKSIYMKSGISKLNDIGDKDNFDKQLFKAFESTHQNTKDRVSTNIVHFKRQELQSDTQKDEKEKINQERSRSVGNKKQFSTLYYSNQMTQILNPKIIGVLQQKKINQIKLINMGQQDIRRIDGLTSSQKNLLLIRKNNVKSPNYTNDLEKFFYRYRRRDILQKMKGKKVKQQKLLLLDSEIRELSFLTQSEKKLLPSMIKEYRNNQEFESINEDIRNEVGSEKKKN